MNPYRVNICVYEPMTELELETRGRVLLSLLGIMPTFIDLDKYYYESKRLEEAYLTPDKFEIYLGLGARPDLSYPSYARGKMGFLHRISESVRIGKKLEGVFDD